MDVDLRVYLRVSGCELDQYFVVHLTMFPSVGIKACFPDISSVEAFGL